MNPFYQALVKTIIRNLVLAIGAGLGVSANGSDVEQVVSAAMVLVAFAWSLYDKYKAHQKQLTAQAMGMQVTAQEVEAAVKVGAAPSVLTAKTAIPVLNP